MILSRRHFVSSAVLTTGGLLCLGLTCCRPTATRHTVLIDLAATLPPAAERLGRAFRRQSSEGSVEAAQAIFSDPRWDGASLTDPDAVRLGLMAQITQDFRSERWVDLEGWVLSITEARLCALRD
jgi:hypothetical protein